MITSTKNSSARSYSTKQVSVSWPQLYPDKAFQVCFPGSLGYLPSYSENQDEANLTQDIFPQAWDLGCKVFNGFVLHTFISCPLSGSSQCSAFKSLFVNAFIKRGLKSFLCILELHF